MLGDIMFSGIPCALEPFLPTHCAHLCERVNSRAFSRKPKIVLVELCTENVKNHGEDNFAGHCVWPAVTRHAIIYTLLG